MIMILLCCFFISTIAICHGLFFSNMASSAHASSDRSTRSGGGQFTKDYSSFSDSAITNRHGLERRKTNAISYAANSQDQRTRKNSQLTDHVENRSTSKCIPPTLVNYRPEHSESQESDHDVMDTQTKMEVDSEEPLQEPRRRRASYPGSYQRPCNPPRPPSRQRIYFYHREDPHYGFTNFSPHPVFYKGKLYPTSEHLFQSSKFLEPRLAEHIRTFSDRPSVALSEARRFQPNIRPDWMGINVKVMDEALWYKFQQHGDLRWELLSTGDAELIEESDKDSFWGIGADGQGRNELGKALERLRSKLRGE